MPKPVSFFLQLNEGDLVTLSDVQSQAEFGSVEVDFRVAQIRSYHEPNDCFNLTCYELEGPNEDQRYMLMVKQVDNDYDLFVYYLDTESELYGDDGDREECPVRDVFTEDGEDIKSSLETTIEFDDDESREVTWDKQGSSTFGVEYHDSDGNDGITTVVDYFTNDENDGNDHCFVDWKGDIDKGYLEMWVGCKVEDHEVDVHEISE